MIDKKALQHLHDAYQALNNVRKKSVSANIDHDQAMFTLGFAMGALERGLDILMAEPVRWKHVKRGTTYEEVGRGELQLSVAIIDTPKLEEGDRIVAYRSEDGLLWFRPEEEFDDGRFTRVYHDERPWPFGHVPPQRPQAESDKPYDHKEQEGEGG